MDKIVCQNITGGNANQRLSGGDNVTREIVLKIYPRHSVMSLPLTYCYCCATR